MFRWFTDRLLRLRTWLAVRIGLLRGQWRRGRVSAAGVHGLLAPFSVHVWRYALYEPAGLREDEAAPLLLVLHGCRQRALNFAYAAGLTQFADRARLRLVCPQQRRLANPYGCWNWFLPQAQRGEGELRMLRALLDDVAARVPVQAVAAIGLSAGGGLAALLAFHLADRLRAVVVVAAPPLLGSHNLQDPRDVMKRGLLLPPSTALETQQGACAPLAIIHGSGDEVVAQRCAEQLQEQALAAMARDGLALQRTGSTEAGATDYRSDGALRLRRIEVPGLAHEWSGGPGGHVFCTRGGPPLTQLCAQFLRDAGFGSGPAPMQ